jgi:uncharacterized protein YgbK (DUF1537 family)
MSILLGCIADDFTGATDLAGMLVEAGMRTVMTIDVPASDVSIDTDALVIALKSRTIPAQEAVEQSLSALRWLQKAGCQQYFFKYCSTFDSTDRGNIGPVIDALLDALGSNFTIACPAFPKNKRTLYKGHLFVGDVLLNESGMQHHPLTPMTDANLVRVLGRQAKYPVGLVSYDTVKQGEQAIQQAFVSLAEQGYRYAIVDALEDSHLLAIGHACADMPLVTGGSGISMGLPDNFRRKGLLKAEIQADKLPVVKGKSVVLSGSCSIATQEQVATMQQKYPSFKLDPLRLAEGPEQVNEVIAWATPLLEKGPVLIYATSKPEEVKAVQNRLGVERASQVIENAFAEIAKRLVDLGVQKFIVAGGETSGAVVRALNVTALRIGPQIAPGVPWTTSLNDKPFALALKSGNFGSKNFFQEALDRQP